MTENISPAISEDSVSQSSHLNDNIELVELNDSDENEVASSCSVIVSNNSVNPEQPARVKRENSSDSVLDDSICILYEKIQPPPDIQVVNEIIVDNSVENELDNHSVSFPFSPIILGSYPENSLDEYLHLPFPPLSPVQRTSSSSQATNYSLNSPTRAHQQTLHHSMLPSCEYESVHIRPSPTSIDGPFPILSIPRLDLPTPDAPLNLKTQHRKVPSPKKPSQSSDPEKPSHGSDKEKLNIEYKIPKIQCGICLDGPDEIAAANKSFMSTKCGHVFCDVCIKTALKTVCKCPTCRKRVTSRQIHPLYL